MNSCEKTIHNINQFGVYKRLVAQGIIDQQKGIDYQDAFARTFKWPTIRFLVIMVTKKGWSAQHLDTKNAFLNGDLHED